MLKTKYCCGGHLGFFSISKFQLEWFFASNDHSSTKGPGGSMSEVVELPNNSYKPITNTAWVRARLCKLQKGCTRLAAASDKIYQLLAHGRWFSPGTPASFTTKTDRHDIAEILLKVALKHPKSFKYNLGLIVIVLSILYFHVMVTILYFR